MKKWYLPGLAIVAAVVVMGAQYSTGPTSQANATPEIANAIGNECTVYLRDDLLEKREDGRSVENARSGILLDVTPDWVILMRGSTSSIDRDHGTILIPRSNVLNIYLSVTPPR